MGSEQVIRELENKRKLLNERLMSAKSVGEANDIERELWALRAAIRYHKRRQSEKLKLTNAEFSQNAGT